MSAIDAHTHAFPDSLAARAIAALEEDCPWTAVADGTIVALIQSMDAADIDVSVVCTIATKPEQTKGIFKWCRKIRCDRIEPLPSIHPDTPKIEKWFERFAKAKFAGIKVHPMYQDFAFDDPRMDAIYAAAREHGLFIAAHCGRDIAFMHDDRAAPKRLARVMERRPDLRLLCTHMGGWRAWDEVEQCILGTDVHLETSFSLGELTRQRAVKMIERHGADRVMLGSDWPWTKQSDAIRQVKRLGLDEKQTRAILFSNAARFLGY